jgi:pSer/pThr/pTyr-binding forkhead associated (FHA) protein
MRTSLALLKFAGRALLNAIRSGVTGDLVTDVLPAVVPDIWSAWSRNRDAGQRQAEVEALARLPRDRVRRGVLRVLRKVAADQPRPVRQQLASCLGRMPSAIRHSLRRPDDPTGTTVPPDRQLQGPDDLRALLSPLLRRAVAKDEDAEKTQGETAAAGRITLTVATGPHKGRVFSFVGHDTFLVGRSKGAHFRLPSRDKFFSRLHFMVELNPPICRLMDLGSRNGTYVNGQQVDTADLRNGDRIKAGHTILDVAIEEEAAPPTSRRERSSAVAVAAPTARPAAAAPTTAVPGACATCGYPADGAAVCRVCRDAAAREGQRVAGYLILRELGRGGMGVVFLALREDDGSLVALKTIVPTVSGARNQVSLFLREARILEHLDHPNIVAFQEMGESEGRLYFAMDYVRGTDAAALLKEHGPLPVARAVGLVRQLLRALDYAHAKQFVHRDIKPANLLVAEEDGQEVARLADFGLARVYQASQLSGLTMTGDIGGTVAFMAPEQITNYREAKPAVDQYAAAASLYQLLTGKLPFDLPRTSQERLLMILHEEPVPIRERRPDLPAELAEVIHRALAKEPDERFAGVKALRQALRPFARD